MICPLSYDIQQQSCTGAMCDHLGSRPFERHISSHVDLSSHFFSASTAVVQCVTGPSRTPPALSCPVLCYPHPTCLSSLMVDLYPLALHVSVCDAAGRPGGRERLVLTSHHVHVRDMLLEALDNSNSMHGLSRGLSMPMSLAAAPSTQDEVSGVLGFSL